MSLTSSDPARAATIAGTARPRDASSGCGELISLEEARSLVLAAFPGLPDEEVRTERTAGRILAKDIFATSSLPQADVAAMDGIAVRLSDVEPGRLLTTLDPDASLPFVRVRSGLAHPICTGMPIPTGLEAVVPIERVRPSDGWLDIQGVVRAGDHIRRAGEEIQAGERAVPAGTRINPATIGLLLALGHDHIPVCVAPRVGILVTGEELFASGGPRPDGAVVDSNGPMLESLVAGAGGVLVERLLVTDDPAAIQYSLERLAAECHLVITSGGASVGTRDHLVATVRASGELMIHQLDMKPGRPTSLGLIDGTAIVLLPGNPLAALIGFEAIGRPTIRSLAGDRVPLRRRVAARALAPIAHKPGRLECVPVQVSWVSGCAAASPLDHHGSGMLRGASLADGVAILEPDRGAVIEGDELAVELWA